MKIADVSAFYSPRGGGVRTYVERKLDHAERAGLDLSVIVPGETDRIEPRGRLSRLIHVASPRLVLDRRYRYFQAARPVHAVLDDLVPDLVEASSPWRTASIVADWRGPARRVLFLHADPLAAYAYRWFEGIASRPLIDRGFDRYWAHLRRVATACDLVVTANADFAARLAARRIERTETIPLGVDPGIFAPSHRDERLRAALLAGCSLGPEATLLVGVGRFAPEKRWHTMIEAAALAGRDRPVGLVLVGEGRGRAILHRQIGGNPHIRLLAPIRARPEMARLLASADALVHGCEAETFGLVAAEAVASGLPIVVPGEGGAGAQARPGCSATYAPGDARAAAAAIARLLAADPVARRSSALAAAAASRSMDAHFADLFTRYARLAERSALAA